MYSSLINAIITTVRVYSICFYHLYYICKISINFIGFQYSHLSLAVHNCHTKNTQLNVTVDCVCLLIYLKVATHVFLNLFKALVFNSCKCSLITYLKVWSYVVDHGVCISLDTITDCVSLNKQIKTCEIIIFLNDFLSYLSVSLYCGYYSYK